MKAESAEQTVASGAWNGGLVDAARDGVKTTTFGASAEPRFSDGLPPAVVLPLVPVDGELGGAGGGDAVMVVSSGRKTWIVWIGRNR